MVPHNQQRMMRYFWTIYVGFGNLMKYESIKCSLVSKPSRIKNRLVLTQKWKNQKDNLISVSVMVRHNFKILNSKFGESRGR